ncbi:HNH nuclease [Peribacillus sp. SIMBA_075]|uniref:HNH nuclease n=1 Tax=Peribacillus sp. SIMBA_075 TaxID=3085813 RepID=UPI00397AD812
MIKINMDDKVRKNIQTEHFQDLNMRAKDTIKELIKTTKYKNLKHYICDKTGNIDEKKLKKLLIGSKSDLIEIINIIGEIKLGKKDPFENLYTNFTKRVWSKSLMEKLNVRVCPYCNRLYTFTLGKEGIRPQFDHFFPKSLFSYLSVSLYNLIPSCGICNQKKQALDTKMNDFYYPYEDEFGYNVVFQTSSVDNDFTYWAGTSDNFDIKLTCKDKNHNCKVNNLNEHLKIELLYKQHKDYVRDIIRNAVIYNDSRIVELMEQFPELFESKNELLNLVFMSFIEKENWGNRPLSKLTHDIYEEFKLFTSK